MWVWVFAWVFVLVLVVGLVLLLWMDKLDWTTGSEACGSSTVEV